MSQHTVIFIVGPTAVGKTAVAVDVAQQFHTEIISADSRQCYREMNIGVARPSVEELSAVPHHFIASHSVHEEVNAGVYEQYALQKVNKLFQKFPVVIMTGGTGLYIRAFCEGIDTMPGIKPEIRRQLNETYAAKGLAWLQQELALRDLAFWEIAEQQNPHRLLRALEVIMGTGQSITDFRMGQKTERPFRIIKIGLEMDRSLLNQRINQRVDQMMADGLLEEATSLHSLKGKNALQTVGYQEIFDFLDGKTDLTKAVDLIKQHTRQYAKRQMTWFKKDSSIHWVNAAEEMEPPIRKILAAYDL